MEETLTKLGLKREEIEVYLSLLANGAQSATQIAESTSVKRTYVYNIASDLVEKGLVSEAKRGKITTFEPNSPDLLVSLAEKRKIEANQAQIGLESILGTLKAQYGAVEAKPVVAYYEGVDGVKKAYLDLIKEGKPISAIVQTSQVEPELYNWLTGRFVKQRIEAGVSVRAIVSHGEKTKAYIDKNEAELRETKMVSLQDPGFEHEIDIYGDKISIINNKAGEKLLAIIIENKLVAQTFRAWFELTWKGV